MIEPLVLATLLLSAIAAQPAATALVRDDARTATLAAGDVHTYEARLEVGDFLHLFIDQQEVDVVVTVVDPAGRRLPSVDGPYGRDVPESIALVAETTGAYRLEVQPFSGTAVDPVGRYSLSVEAWRPATPADRLQADAEAATRAAHRQAALRTAEAGGWGSRLTVWPSSFGAGLVIGCSKRGR